MTYIYPKATNGEMVALFLNFYFPKESIAFIDDSLQETSLESLKNNIKQEDRVFVCSTLHYEKLMNNLKQCGIANVFNGIVWCGEVLNTKLKHYKSKSNFKKYIGLVENGVDEKCFVDLDLRLKSMGFGLVYLCASLDIYKKYNVDNNVCFLAYHTILEQIEELDMILMTEGQPTHNNVIGIDVTHGFQGPLVYPYNGHTLADKEHLFYTYSMLDYIVVPAQKIHNAYKNLFREMRVDTKLLDTGYLKLDRDMETYKNYVITQEQKGIKEQRDIVIFAFTFLYDIQRLKVLMEQVFALGFRVFYQPHPIFLGCVMPKILESFGANEQFLYNWDKMEAFYHSICLVTECSSVGYTYPLTTCKPSICLRDKDFTVTQEELMREGGGDYYEEKLMYLCNEDKDLSKVLGEIMQTQTMYHQKVQDYRLKECFNFGNAAGALAKQIELILGE